MIYILVLPLKKIYCSPSAINQKTNFPAPSQTGTLLYSTRETPQSGGYEGLTHRQVRITVQSWGKTDRSAANMMENSKLLIIFN